ncbi:hypothetical protein [Nocardia gipuzkoensis]|uniref:hypothetical protein n=1 Tax=Nocardia gipuzkoensis TaxID=2749991 RepID=UPI00237E910F|nr:hypothetical protein [Nocardia gipuzkoensis]MDE1675196.1 hypothetical protein [Nocardia gipuzkoensis]
MGTTLPGVALSDIATTSGFLVLAVVPLLYLLSLTAVFSRDRVRREAARKILALLWRHKGPS